MAKIITENFRVETANELFRSFTEGNASIVDEFEEDMLSWVNAGNISISEDDKTALFGYFPDHLLGIMNDSQPDSTYYIMGSSITKGETITNTQFQKREFLRRVIFGSKISQDNIRYMFDYNAWANGTTYDSFDDTRDISTLNFYVTVLDGDINEGSYKVFKCLRNNNGNPSTVQPSTTDLESNYEVHSSDGYVWKYMFSVPPSEYQVYSTVQSLPYYADATVVANAEESISDIVVETTEGGLLSEYNLGTLSVQQVVLASQDVDAGTYTWEVEVTTTGAVPKNTKGAYKNMYLRFPNEGTIYDILDSDSPTTSNAAQTRFFVTIENTQADFNIEYEKTTECLVVPKVEISTTSGTRAIAYVVLDTNGTIEDIEFVNKGTQYKYATATLLMPPALEDKKDATTLRAVVSPRGGHGSDPISELYMSKLAVITNFFSDNLNEIPESNSYTRVGLVKNPSFRGDVQPSTFDNRMTVHISDDTGPDADEGLPQDYTNYFITQTVNGQEIYARIHEQTYDAVANETTLHLVDYVGAWAEQFEAGSVEIKSSLTATDADTFDINTVSNNDLGLYTDYSGDLLHYVDFDPITRQGGRREKIKFVFDF